MKYNKEYLKLEDNLIPIFRAEVLNEVDKHTIIEGMIDYTEEDKPKIKVYNKFLSFGSRFVKPETIEMKFITKKEFDIIVNDWKSV